MIHAAPLIVARDATDSGLRRRAMNTSKRFLATAVITAALCGFAGTVSAQMGGAGGGGEAMQMMKNSTPKQRAELQTMMMKNKLNLTEKQLPRVAAINLEAAQNMQPVFSSSEGPLMKMRTMRAVNQSKDAALKKVLTPEQYGQYLTMKEEMRSKIEKEIMQKSGGGM